MRLAWPEWHQTSFKEYVPWKVARMILEIFLSAFLWLERRTMNQIIQLPAEVNILTSISCNETVDHTLRHKWRNAGLSLQHLVYRNLVRHSAHHMPFTSNVRMQISKYRKKKKRKDEWKHTKQTQELTMTLSRLRSVNVLSRILWKEREKSCWEWDFKNEKENIATLFAIVNNFYH